MENGRFVARSQVRDQSRACLPDKTDAYIIFPETAAVFLNN